MTTLTSSIRKPEYYHREYENDVKHLKPENSTLQKVQRIGLIAMPFLSLYKPLGSLISLTMNATRSISCLSQTTNALGNGNAKDIGIALFQTTLAVLAIAGTIFGNMYGMVITSGHDALMSLYDLVLALYNGQHEVALEKFLQLANNSIYLTMLLHGSLEIIILSFAAQILIEAFKSQDLLRKFKNGGDILDLLEGFAHIGMAGIRGYQMQPQLKMLQFKWEIEKVLKTQIAKQAHKNTLLDQTKEPQNPHMVLCKTSKSTTVLGVCSIANDQIESGRNNPELTAILLKYQKSHPQTPAIAAAASLGNFHDCSILLDSGIFVINGKELGEALINSIMFNHQDIAKLILDAGHSPDGGITYTNPPYAPLFFALFYDRYDILKLLLERGADPNKSFVYDRRSEYKGYYVGSLLFFALNIETEKRSDNTSIIELIINYGGKYRRDY